MSMLTMALAAPAHAAARTVEALASDVRSGSLVVQLGIADLALAVAMGRRPGVVVHALAADDDERDPARQAIHATTGRALTAVDIESGEQVWRHTPPDDLAAVFACADEQAKAIFVAEVVDGGPGEWTRWPSATAKAIVALDAATGKVKWRHTDSLPMRVTVLAAGHGKLLAFSTWGILSGMSKNERDYRTDGILLLDAQKGTTDWVVLHKDDPGFNARDAKLGIPWHQMGFIRDDGIWVGQSKGLYHYAFDGTQQEGIQLDRLFNQNCTRATGSGDKWFLGFGTVVKPDGQYTLQDISRSGCNTGTIQANGLVYQTANGCGCFAMVRGWTACDSTPLWPPTHDDQRLITGSQQPAPAGGEVVPREPSPLKIEGEAGKRPRLVRGVQFTDDPTRDSWLNNELSGHTQTPPMGAGDLNLVAVVQEGRLEARKDGRVAWVARAGGRITHAPVVHASTVFFSSDDGWVYAHRLADGAPLWRYQVARTGKRIVTFGQVASPTPVPNVVLFDGLICAAAGLHPELDGGIRLVGLDPATGEKRWGGTIAYDTAHTWFKPGTRDQQWYLNTITNGGLVANDNKLLLKPLDQNYRMKSFEIDPANPPAPVRELVDFHFER